MLRSSGDVWVVVVDVPQEELIENVERALIVKASEFTGWNQSRTAEVLQHCA